MKRNVLSYREKILEALKKNNGIITASYCRSVGIPSIYLTKMVREGFLKRHDRGVYLSKDADYDEYYFFQSKCGRCIYSYTSALYLHDMTDKIPDKMEITVYKGYNASKIKNSVIVHYVDKNIYNMGIVDLRTIFGNSVKSYDKERTVCDLIKNRNGIDPEIFSKAINNYMRRRDKDINKLFEYSKKLKIERQVREILEVLYE